MCKKRKPFSLSREVSEARDGSSSELGPVGPWLG